MARQIFGHCRVCGKRVLLRYHDPVTEDHLIASSHMVQVPEHPVFVECEGSEQETQEEKEAAHP